MQWLLDVYEEVMTNTTTFIHMKTLSLGHAPACLKLLNFTMLHAYHCLGPALNVTVL